MPSPGAESIGSMFSGIGSFTEGIFPQSVYILWMTEPCATISPVGKSGSLILDSTPPPQPWEARASGLPAFSGLGTKALEELGDGHLAVLLAEHLVGRFRGGAHFLSTHGLQCPCDRRRLRRLLSNLLSIGGSLRLRLMRRCLRLRGRLGPCRLQRGQALASDRADPVGCTPGITA